MKIFISITLCLIILIAGSIYFFPASNVSKSTTPRYTWVAFSSFWNKRAIPTIKLKNIEKIKNTYIAHYGHGVTVTIYEKEKLITSACANFFSINNSNNTGGIYFVKIKDRMIDVGAFRWPLKKTLEARDLFSNIGKDERNYAYMTSAFTLDHTASEGWTFCLRYISEEENN